MSEHEPDRPAPEPPADPDDGDDPQHLAHDRSALIPHHLKADEPEPGDDDDDGDEAAG